MNRKKIDVVKKKKFSISKNQFEELKKRNVEFLKRVEEAQVHKKGFDYSYRVPYEERCDDLKVFLIHAFTIFEEYQNKYYEKGVEKTYLRTKESEESDLLVTSRASKANQQEEPTPGEKTRKTEAEKFKAFKKQNFGIVTNQSLDSINKKNLEKFRKLKKMMEKFNETQLHIQPLIELCESYRLNKEILKSLYHASHFALNRDYVKATDHYMQIAIGNNPWPIGVTMVGVHERAGRSRIFTHVIKRRFGSNCRPSQR